LHSEELHKLYTSPNIVRVIRSRKIRWEKHVAHMESMIIHTNFLSEILKRRDHLEYLGIDGRITLGWI